MKTCPSCQEDVKDGAIKCRYCHSSFTPVSDKSITYVVDSGLIRFGKFAVAILAMFTLVGAYFFGLDLKKASVEIADAKKTTDENRKLIDQATKDIEQVKAEIDDRARRVKEVVDSLSQTDAKYKGIVAGIDSASTSTLADDRAAQLLQSLLPKYLEKVLTDEQLQALRGNITLQATQRKYSRAEVLDLITQDTARAFDYFHAHGFTVKTPSALVDSSDVELANSYWDGDKLIYGMGMVNSQAFGPYEPGVVFHEVTHALFDIEFAGESGSVSESICDVIGVVIRGSGWYIGFVKSDDEDQQYLRSLSAPGTAYDSPFLGKDTQPDHMKGFVRTKGEDRDNGGVHANNGILNKAAFLLSEGGTHEGVEVPKGIGRTALGSLYLEVIKRLPKKRAVSFVAFRDLVVSTATATIGADAADTARLAFKAVGL